MTTIKDIARLAGVSIATVSRVLNGQNGVSESKRQRVLKVAEDTNYSLARFAPKVNGPAPRILVLLTDERLSDETVTTLSQGILAAQHYYADEEFSLTIVTRQDLEAEPNLFREYEAVSNDPEGIIIFGRQPEQMYRLLNMFRGRGTIIVQAIGKSDAPAPPFTTVNFDTKTFYEMILEYIVRSDQERRGLFLHQAPETLDGEGLFSRPEFRMYLAKIKDLFPEGSVLVHNIGKFTAELLTDASFILTDSTGASEAVADHFRTLADRPHILAFGNSKRLTQALENGEVDALIELSGFELAFHSTGCLLQRLLKKRQAPEQQFILPRLYTPAMISLLNNRQMYPSYVGKNQYNANEAHSN